MKTWVGVPKTQAKACQHIPAIPAPSRDRKLARVCSAPCLAKLVRSRFSDRYCCKKIRWWRAEEGNQCSPLSSTHTGTHMHTCTHEQMYICIHDIQHKKKREEQSYRGLQKNIAGTLRNTCEREKQYTKQRQRQSDPPHTHSCNSSEHKQRYGCSIEELSLAFCWQNC